MPNFSAATSSSSSSSASSSPSSSNVVETRAGLSSSSGHVDLGSHSGPQAVANACPKEEGQDSDKKAPLAFTHLKSSLKGSIGKKMGKAITLPGLKLSSQPKSAQTVEDDAEAEEDMMKPRVSIGSVTTIPPIRLSEDGQPLMLSENGDGTLHANELKGQDLKC